MNFSKIILSVFLFSAVNDVMAQKDATIKATIDKNRILIGEPIVLSIEMRLPGSASASSFKLDSIPHFEILEPPVIDSSNENGITIIKTLYTITSFDSGHWVIPSYRLSARVRSDTLPVDVLYTDVDPNKDYNDIKDIIEVKLPKKKKWWLYAIAGGLLLVAAMVYFLRKKKPVPVPATPAVPLNACEEAIKELEELQQSKPETKIFHSRLTGIFRLYVYRKKGILSLQKTTDDLVLQLKSLDIGKEQFDRLAQALRLSDFVKFAKYVPTNEDDMNCLNEIKNSIIDIEKQETNSPSLGGS